MPSEEENRLAEFVDRFGEMARFRKMLDTGEKPIMAVWGDGGFGKTSLLTWMKQECTQRNLRKVEFEWKHDRNYSHLHIMRDIREGVGADYFKRFTDLVNYFYEPGYKLKLGSEGPISVADGAVFDDTTVEGDIGGIIIKDCRIFVPRPDLTISENERRIRLTECFIKDLATATSKKGELLVLFFDAVEKMANYTRKWVWGEMLDAVAGEKLANVRFVLSGRNPPELEREIKRFVEEVQLQPLEREYVIEYLKKKGVEEYGLPCIADTLLVTTDCSPLQIAIAVDSLLEMWRARRQSCG